MKYSIRVAPQAEKQIRDAARWWRENRPKARNACTEEIERGFDLVSSLPGIGESVEHPRLKGVRRLLLGRIRYHLYYRFETNSKIVEVLALWHTSRGSGPTLDR